MQFIHNAWYVAGWASEFGEDLRRVTILATHLVMYRTSEGDVIALEDRCPTAFYHCPKDGASATAYNADITV